MKILRACMRFYLDRALSKFKLYRDRGGEWVSSEEFDGWSYATIWTRVPAKVVVPKAVPLRKAG